VSVPPCPAAHLQGRRVTRGHYFYSALHTTVAVRDEETQRRFALHQGELTSRRRLWWEEAQDEGRYNHTQHLAGIVR
jgi:hypothetical protein